MVNVMCADTETIKWGRARGFVPGWLTLNPRRGERARTAAAAAARHQLNLTVPAAAMATRTGGRRSRDRQRGNARGEKHPGHDNISFRTAKRPVRGAVPTSNRCSLRPTALV